MKSVKSPLTTSCFMEAWDGCYLIHIFHRVEILTHWEMTLKVLRILLSEELEMEAGYGEWRNSVELSPLELVSPSFQWRSFGLFIGVEKLKLMMTWHLYIKFHALLRRLFTSSAHLFCHILIACYTFAYWHDSFCPGVCIYFFSTHGLNT